MDLRVLLFVSVATVLVFPQYAFSIGPTQDNSNIAFGESNSTVVSTSAQETLDTGTSDVGNSSSTSHTSAGNSSSTSTPNAPTSSTNISSPVVNSTSDNSISSHSVMTNNTSLNTASKNNTSLNTSVTPTANATTKIVQLDSTSSAVAPNTSTVTLGSQIQFTARTFDTTNSQNIPSGIVTWTDGNVGGTFNPSSCSLSSGDCIVTYTPNTNYRGSVIITSSYGGDVTHSGSTGTSTLTSNIASNVAIAITSSAGAISPGSQVQLTAAITDTSNLPTTPTGTISWSDNNVGGTFNPSSCSISSGGCAVSYT